jgi:hypothetical protein
MVDGSRSRRRARGVFLIAPKCRQIVAASDPVLCTLGLPVFLLVRDTRYRRLCTNGKCRSFAPSERQIIRSRAPPRGSFFGGALVSRAG